MTTTIDKKEYLKKYLSSAKALKKRSKKDKKKGVRVKIIDDDLDLATFNEAVTEDLTRGEIEDAPQIVGVMDERPPELRLNDYKTEMWKSVTVLDSDEESDDIKARRKREENERDLVSLRIKVEPTDLADNSPPRQRKKGSYASDDNSPPRQRKKKGYLSDDNSPPRRTSNKNARVNTLPSQRRKTSDVSPRRKSINRYAKEISPPGRERGRKREDNNETGKFKSRRTENCSPARRDQTQSCNDNSQESIKSLHIGHDDGRSKKTSRWNKVELENENSPPRNASGTSNVMNVDSSPPRRRREDQDSSPPRRKSHRAADEETRKKDIPDNSQPMKSRSDRDRTSPPTRKHQDDHHSSKNSYRTYKDGERNRDRNLPSTSKSDRQRSSESDPSSKNERCAIPWTSKLGDNKGNSGSRQQIYHHRDQTDGNSRRDKSVSDRGSHDVDISVVEREETDGQNYVPKTIVRDRKTGRIRNLEEEAAVKREKAKERAAIQEQYSHWGKGVKQVNDANEKRAQDLHEMQKPLARYADDTDLEAMLKNREREGDPMLEYLRKKKREKAATKPNAEPEKAVYQGDCGPPNRYGIRPGHRWDGVDRSNGYEKKYFEVQNARKVHQAESYKWSSEDM